MNAFAKKYIVPEAFNIIKDLKSKVREIQHVRRGLILLYSLHCKTFVQFIICLLEAKVVSVVLTKTKIVKSHKDFCKEVLNTYFLRL